MAAPHGQWAMQPAHSWDLRQQPELPRHGWQQDDANLRSCAKSSSKCGPGCSGVSPTGVHWSYVMPQHTGTATVFIYLKQVLGLGAECVHNHTTWHPPDVSAAFTFVADPYHRVLSSAAFHEIIGRKGQTAQGEVASFRRWLKSYQGRKGELLAFLHGQKRMHSFFPKKLGIGRTESLAADLERALTRLGYELPSSPIVFNETHCISSCGTDDKAENEGAEVVGSGAGVTIHNDDDELDWYDEDARRFVWQLFQDDFRTFNFSVTPSRRRLSHLRSEARAERLLG